VSQGSKPLGETSLSILELFRLVRSAADMGGGNVTLLLNARNRVNKLIVKTEDISILAISSRVASRQIVNSSFDEFLYIKNGLWRSSLLPGFKRREENLKLDIVGSTVARC
jgi:hypothetical protein